MASKVHAGNKTATRNPKTVTESEFRAIDAVETEWTVETAPKKQVEPLGDHPTITKLTPAGETTISKKVHSAMASNVHSGNGTAAKTPKTELPSTAVVETKRTLGAEVKMAPEKKAKPVADHPTVTEVAGAAETTIPKKKWPGRPGDCMFRVIVPVHKVESITGGKGDLIKKMCEETEANIRILKGPVWYPYLIVQISGREDTEAPLSHAMDAVIRVFKRVNGFPENESDGVASIPFCSIRLLLTSMQAMSLNGKQGSSINKIKENTGCSVRILSSDEVSTLSANSDDRIIDIQGEALKVLQALEAVDKHLRMFYADKILPLPEKMHNTMVTQEKNKVVTWAEKSMILKDTHPKTESEFPSRPQVAVMMQISLVDAVNMMGAGGTNFGCTSGAVFTFQESKSSCKIITVEIKGTLSQVQAAQQLIQGKIGLRRGASFGAVRGVVDQVAQTMDIPLADAVAIIGVGGSNFGCTNGAIFTIQDTKISRKRITIKITGTSSQVRIAKQLIQAKAGPDRVSFGRVKQAVDQVLTRPGEVTPEPPLIPPSAATEPPVEPQTEPMACNTRHLSPPPHITATSSGIESIKELKLNKVRWHINIVKTFLDACIHEITTHGWEDGSLKAMSWKKVGEILKDTHNFSVDDRQMKNYFDGLKRKYNAWVSLKNKTPNIYDPSTNTFNLTDNEWETEIKKNKCIETLRIAPLRFPDLCAQLFDGSVDQALTGEASFEPQALSPLIPPLAETSPPLAATETPKEPILVKVPPELPQVQTPTALVPLETKAEVPSELQLMAIENESEVPLELPKVQLMIQTKLPEVQPAMETKAVVPVETDDSNVDEVAMQMEVEESVLRSRPVREFFGQRLGSPGLVWDFPGPNWAFSGPGKHQDGSAVLKMPTFYRPDHTAPGYFRSGIDQVKTGPSPDRVHLYKDRPLPSHRCNTNSLSRPRPISPPPYVSAAPSGKESIKEAKRSRVFWNVNIVKTFLDACIHEIAINGWEDEDGSLKARSWKRVGEILKDRHSFSVDSKQMKNYFDGLKSKYNAWVSLKNKTPNIYDPSTNMFNLTDKEWETEIKENKCIETLRRGPLPFPDLCGQLFDGGVDQALTGEITHEPQAAAPLSAETSPRLAATEAPVEPQKEPIRVEVQPELPQVQPVSELRSLSVFEEELLGVVKMIAEKINEPEPPSKPTFEDCEKKLNGLGWANDDPLHLVALTIFCDENVNYRDLWMKLHPERCADWVRMIGRSKRFT